MVMRQRMRGERNREDSGYTQIADEEKQKKRATKAGQEREETTDITGGVTIETKEALRSQ